MGQPDRFDSLAGELVALAPAVIACVGRREMAALQAATRAISIVFMQVNNSVKQGFVASLARSPSETLRECARAPGNDPNQRRRRGDLAGAVAAGAALVRSERFTEVIRAAHSRLSS